MVYSGGLHALGFAIFHSRFWKIFNWKSDLENLTAANKAFIQIANLRLIYIFVFVAAICFVFPKALLTTNLGRFFMIGMALFWLGRTIEQFIFVRIEHRLVHLLTYLFIIGAVIWAIPVLL
jgi:hypothetical protein